MPEASFKEVSAGGVVLALSDGVAQACLILRDRHGHPGWNLPKGHLQPGETVSEAAVREVTEETGLNVGLSHPLASIQYWVKKRNRAEPVHKTVHFFLMRHTGGTLTSGNEEVLEARWIPYEEALQKLEHASERRILEMAYDLFRRQAKRPLRNS